MPRSEVLRTDRLVLTSWHLDDVDDLFEVHSDPATMRFVRHGRPESRDEVATLIGEYMAEYERTGVTKWRVADHEGRLVGRAGFGTAEAGRELGYTIRRDRWRQGLATELARALVSWHREHAADMPLRAYVSQRNPASSRVLVKVGFEPVGTVERRGDVHVLHRLVDGHEDATVAPGPRHPR
ncbi:MAG: GNAT family N-acetyltransferase [Dermatophilaceae bacterium]